MSIPLRKVSTFWYSSLACNLGVVLIFVQNPIAGMPRFRRTSMSDVAGNTIGLNLTPLEQNKGIRYLLIDKFLGLPEQQNFSSFILVEYLHVIFEYLTFLSKYPAWLPSTRLFHQRM